VTILACLYKKRVPGLSSGPAGSKLKALKLLEQADCLSYDKLERLGEIMKVLEWKDLSKKVDNFISKPVNPHHASCAVCIGVAVA